jgi:hypothetical protein
MTRLQRSSGPVLLRHIAVPAARIHHESGVRAVIDVPHRRRAALVATLALLLTLWLRQTAVAGPVPQPDTSAPFNQSLLAEDWLD